MAFGDRNPWAQQGPLMAMPQKPGMGQAGTNQSPGVVNIPAGPLTQIEQQIGVNAAMKGAGKGYEAGVDAWKAWNAPTTATATPVAGPATGTSAMVETSLPALTDTAATATADTAAATAATEAAATAAAEAAATDATVATVAATNEWNPVGWAATAYLGGKALGLYSRGTSKVVDFNNPADPFGFAKGGFVNPYMIKRQPAVSPNEQPNTITGQGFGQGMVTHSAAPLTARKPSKPKGLPELHNRMLRPGGEI